MRFTVTVAALVAVCVGAALVLGAGAGGPAERLVFKNHGFSIAPLDETAKGSSQVLMMFLPPSNGFAPNVNVQAQEYAGTMEDYAALSRKQMEDMKIKVLSDKVDKGVLTLEYSGNMQGNDLHGYIRAIQRGDKVFLTTGIARADQWQDVSAKIKACVDSFALQAAKPVVAPAK